MLYVFVVRHLIALSPTHSIEPTETLSPALRACTIVAFCGARLTVMWLCAHFACRPPVRLVAHVLTTNRERRMSTTETVSIQLTSNGRW